MTISAQEFADALAASQLPVVQAARALGVSRETVYKYLENGVTRRDSIAKVRPKLDDWLAGRRNGASPLAGYSDMALLAEAAQLLAEVARRLDEASTPRGGKVTDESQGSPDPGRHGGSNGGRIRGTGSAEPPQ